MIACFLSNISAKYYENPSMLSRVIAKNVGDVFFVTQCRNWSKCGGFWMYCLLPCLLNSSWLFFYISFRKCFNAQNSSLVATLVASSFLMELITRRGKRHHCSASRAVSSNSLICAGASVRYPVAAAATKRAAATDGPIHTPDRMIILTMTAAMHHSRVYTLCGSSTTT